MKSPFAFAALLSLLGAAPADAQQDRNAPWYAGNHAQRQTMLELCQTDPGRLHLHPDCVNARNGDIRALVRELEAARGGVPPAAPFAPSRARVRRL